MQKSTKKSKDEAFELPVAPGSD